MIPKRRTAILLAALLTTAAAVIGFSLAAEENRSAFEPAGDGPWPLVEDARSQGLEVSRLVSSPLSLSSPGDAEPDHALVAVVTPSRGYSADEREHLRAFVQSGGRLLVADNFGQANSLTTHFGLTLERVRLVESDPTRLANATLEGRTFRIWLQAPTAINFDAGSSARVLAYSSAQSFVDRDGDGIISASDPRGPFPVAIELSVGQAGGSLIVVSDPGPFTAPGADEADNRAWRTALLAYLLPNGGSVFVDESRQASPDPFVAGLGAMVGAATSAPWKYVLIGLGLLLAALVFRPYADSTWAAHRFRPNHFVRRALLRGATGSTAPQEAHAGERSFWTRRGVTAAVLGLALALLGLAFGSTQAGYASAFLLVACAAALLPAAPRVSAKRELSKDALEESANLDVNLELTVKGHGMDLEFREQLPKEFEVRQGTNWFQTHVNTHAATRLAYSASPALRGPFVVGPLAVRRRDALGLRVEQEELLSGANVRVRPRKDAVRKIRFKTKVPTVTMGPHLVNRAGDGSEFHSLRDYQHGDSFRNVNWKASARSKQLVVNQRVHESLTTLTLFLDARAISGAGPASKTPLAHGCRAVVSVASGAIQARDRVRLIIYGKGVHELPPASGAELLEELPKVLADLRPEGDTTFLAALEGTLAIIRPKTPVMLVSGLEDDPSIPDGIRLLRSRGVLPLVVASHIGTHPVDAEDGPADPDADALQKARRETLTTLQSMDLPVFDAPPDVPLDYLFRVGGGS